MDIRDDVIADLDTVDGRSSMIEEVTDRSGGVIDAVLAAAGVDIAGPRAVAVSSITSVHPFDQQLLELMLDESEDQALERARDTDLSYATSKRVLSRWIRRNAARNEWTGAGIPLNAMAPGEDTDRYRRRRLCVPKTLSHRDGFRCVPVAFGDHVQAQ